MRRAELLGDLLEGCFQPLGRVGIELLGELRHLVVELEQLAPDLLRGRGQICIGIGGQLLRVDGPMRVEQLIEQALQRIVVRRVLLQLVHAVEELSRDSGLLQGHVQGVAGRIFGRRLERVRGDRVGVKRGSQRDDLVGVHVAARFLAKEPRDCLLDRHHAALAADHEHVVELNGSDHGRIDAAGAEVESLLDQWLNELVHLAPGECGREVDVPTVGELRQVGQLYLSGVDLGQLDLGFLGRLLETQQRGVVVERGVELTLELLPQPGGDRGVEVLAAEVGVPVGGQHLEGVSPCAHDRDVEGAAAEVVDREREVPTHFVAVGERGRRRLVDQASHVDAGMLGGQLGRLALHVVEVCGNGDHGLGSGLAERLLRVLAHAAQNPSGDLNWRQLPARDLEQHTALGAGSDRVGRDCGRRADLVRVEGVTQQALDRGHGVLGLGHRVALCGPSDELLVAFECETGRNGRVLILAEDDGAPVLDRRGTAVERAQIDANDSTAHSPSIGILCGDLACGPIVQ